MKFYTDTVSKELLDALVKKGYPYKTGEYLEVGTINEDGSVNPIPPVEKPKQKESFFLSAFKKKKDKKASDQK